MEEIFGRVGVTSTFHGVKREEFRTAPVPDPPETGTLSDTGRVSFMRLEHLVTEYLSPLVSTQKTECGMTGSLGQ